ncbi:hypothetical protein M501DRAFT_989143 [Patellaria atrata CBS 101060]|uniref:RED-like N-terminal domain-containing protein n=1 Tax=Patellaria atrata CBS 101060 TaxID=1346257 RepID=A0A9P4S457_9PEZI|nr:hypothetical protein M501DRAFT_989143 [Patellaria atrata CBS 101060]
MNQDDFRKLVQSTPRVQNGTSTSSSRPSGTPSTLGSRARASIPMTPRSVRGAGGVDFKRQLADRNASNQPSKKFKSWAPKGSRLAEGYIDRAKERAEHENEVDEKEERIRALEEQMKLGQIDQRTFESLRDRITGGDLSMTHLVKGLDRKLLERVKRGEDVFKSGPSAEKEEQGGDVDEELEKLEEKGVTPVPREKTVKKGEMAPPHPPPAPVAGVKRTRDAILAELKASRKAAAEAKKAALPQLGSKFRKIGEQRAGSRVEIDERGREVLITVDEDGHVKRRVKKVKEENGGASDLSLLDKTAKPLGMEVPDLPPAPPPEESDDDIFEGVGDDYNPLGDIPDASNTDTDTDSDDEEGETKGTPKPAPPSPSAGSQEPEEPPSPKPTDTARGPRNYFNDTASPLPTSSTSGPLTDSTVLAVLQKVRMLDVPSATELEAEARLRRRAAELGAADRDLEDLDMGFGSSRFDDAEDLEGGERLKLSEWGADDDNGEEGGKGNKKGGRKRGPKKRKGDKNSAVDVLRVMESRKKDGG